MLFCVLQWGMGKEKFYIFLDIDGVLWDWKWRISEVKNGRVRGGGIVSDFDPASIGALNSLISTLSSQYDCRLVVSSTWRVNMNLTERALRKNGVLIPDDILERTPLTVRRGSRGREIIAYLCEKEDNNNFVIIDDEMFDYEQYFYSKQIIKTDIYSGALNKQHVIDWFDVNNIEHEMNSDN